ncbi:hypothetical protein TSOC_004820 [Tetrabaena socialis]|uniref:Uncharacterized protein n=1 Tax=Tetrabaena socialis TaxID=47790 RepID=A0A2J8A7Z3_9CHLO|nr:hypothetical protein TSOC_004820 [Tetrabaena socialis]|eukprot:PNH08625.1 hypothetical protein TSOC_004820 [Tetrabaena socialis]
MGDARAASISTRPHPAAPAVAEADEEAGAAAGERMGTAAGERRAGAAAGERAGATPSGCVNKVQG